MDAKDPSHDCAPIAAILYHAGNVPGIEDLIGASQRDKGFAVTHAAPATQGWAEVLRDGLTFDLHGLAAGAVVGAPVHGHLLGLQPGQIDGCSALLLCPGPHLAGAENVLPVIRVAAQLLVQLARIGDPQAICWIPAKNAVSPELFARAVTPWLDGGPFPALALAALRPEEDGSFTSEGLKFLIGQEFSLTSDGGAGREQMAKVAVRLIDWLVAHGPVSTATQAVLAGTGAVFLEPQGSTRIVARCA